MGAEYVRDGDLYEVLGVHPDATPEEIERAHRQLIRKHHPDLGGDEALAKAINFARDVLVDPAQRRRYDQLRDEYLAMHRSYAQSVAPSVPSRSAMSTYGPSVASEYLRDDIDDAMRSGDWLGALAMAFATYGLDRVAYNATKHNTIARSALDSLAELMRAQRRKREHDAHEARARIERNGRETHARLTARMQDRIANLRERIDNTRAAAQSPVRKKRDC